MLHLSLMGLVALAGPAAPFPSSVQATGKGDATAVPHGAAPVLVPPEAPRRRGGNFPVEAAAGVAFVNFDGAELQWGWDDATENETQIPPMVGAFAPYGDDAAKRAAVMQAVREDWAAYGITITDERPADGEYTMCMVGPTNPYGPNVLGIAPLDCADAQTHANVTFAFHSATDGRGATMTATTIGQEIAHSYGLEHVDDPSDIMNPYNIGGDPWFHEECLPVVGDVSCAEQHAWGCGAEDSQSAHLELLALFGPFVPDAIPPEVEIVAPRPDAVVELGSVLVVEVAASDPQGVAEVRLRWDGELVASDSARPLGWELSDLPEGQWRLEVEAVDFAGNVGRSEAVLVHVVEPEDEPDPADDPLDDDDGTTSGGDGDASRDGVGESSEGGGDPADDDLTPADVGYPAPDEASIGLACRASGRVPEGPRPFAFVWILLSIVGAGRRRASPRHALIP